MNTLGVVVATMTVAFVTSFLLSILIGKVIKGDGHREPEFYVHDWNERTPGPKGVNHERE